MMRANVWGAVCAAVMVLSMPVARAQEAQSAPRSIERLKFDIVVTRSATGTTPTAAPFSLIVTGIADAQGRLSYPVASVRVGVDVPTSVYVEGKSQTITKTIGTQIDCRASSGTPGYYSANISISDTAAYAKGIDEDVERARIDLANMERVLASRTALHDRQAISDDIYNTAVSQMEEAKLRLRLAEDRTTRPARIDLSALRTLTLQNVVVLKDGETQEIATATDRTTGETIKATVKLSVLR